MIYVTSDIHGCFDKYKLLLERLKLKSNDKLYILGDLVDRGEGGLKVILDLIPRKNIICLRGNHDNEAYRFLRHFTASGKDRDERDFTKRFESWLSDGGTATYAEFLKINDTQKKQTLAFLRLLPLFEIVEVQGRKYHLSHTVPEKDRMLKPEGCTAYDFIMGEPEYEKKYFTDMVLVTGHTPTGFIDPEYKGRIWKGNNHIAVDCGAAFGNPLGCICLDTMEEIYVEEGTR